MRDTEMWDKSPQAVRSSASAPCPPSLHFSSQAKTSTAWLRGPATSSLPHNPCKPLTISREGDPTQPSQSPPKAPPQPPQSPPKGPPKPSQPPRPAPSPSLGAQQGPQAHRVASPSTHGAARAGTGPGAVPTPAVPSAPLKPPAGAHTRTAHAPHPPLPLPSSLCACPRLRG